MSNDVDGLDDVPGMFHETWGYALEVLIALNMLRRKLGVVCILPLVIIVVCSRVSRYVAKNARARQTAWNEATQRRLDSTSHVLLNMKNVKMLGMQEAVVDHIEHLRQNEIAAANRVRWMNIAYNASGKKTIECMPIPCQSFSLTNCSSERKWTLYSVPDNHNLRTDRG